MSSSEEVFLALCRPGFESDLAAELTDRCAELGASGYPQTTDDSGYVLWNNLQGDPDALLETGLIFGRSFYPLTAAFEDLPEQDRIGALWPELERQGPFAELFLEHADTNASRELARFLRGFRKALEPRLRKAGLLRDRADRRLHLFFEDSRNGRVGVSPLAVPLPEGGLTRLRLAPEAPSRSALKLEEAMLRFLGRGKPPGLHTAVDLGAAPGGWSWQLARLGIKVTGVDHGRLDPRLLDEYPVRHVSGDAFTWRPERPVDLVVCDVVDKPARTLALMQKWLEQGWARTALFNLKLPMARRYRESRALLERLGDGLERRQVGAMIQAAHLYHDREEITVWVDTRAH
ncbi:RNA 2'-O-ribose methyltransferase [Alcanivorax sp. 521-1]|uniref:RNA 2'-O-ribose methyltransferase n=1 Tax=Alloalcanivorax profundimaris TaxID=2735259 RepID=A0ABS0AXM0_9GAMM|nr:23S rRNA (cytidine(2498)-2'-O)-methyltransferase RlmM [Alloalcanivorax profundimaris]MBF5058206.1 RNA 2'-O-ribose methyltransferase [Alloalcanivorax profundimaris]